MVRHHRSLARLAEKPQVWRRAYTDDRIDQLGPELINDGQMPERVDNSEFSTEQVWQLSGVICRAFALAGPIGPN
jgi:hypothetical protein